MSNSKFPLTNLPFDILLEVIELLDHGDIYSLCLVSRGFDSTATPVLYRTLKWAAEAGFTPLEGNHTYRPCLAFQRRPLLRNHVQSVTLSSRKYGWGFRLQGSEVRSICKELSLLPSLYKLEWYKWQSSSVAENALGLLIDTMAKLPRVRGIHIPAIITYKFMDLSPLTRPFTHISIRHASYLATVTEWLEKQQEHLQELHIVCYRANFSLSNNFRALRRFSQDVIREVPGFLAAIKEMNQLQELSFGLFPVEILSWDPSGQPLNLPGLQSLKINILDYYGAPDNTFTRSIFYCYTSFGTHSRDLQTVHICAPIPLPQSKIQGDKLFSKISKDHATSIRTLRLDDMSATRETLMRLFSRCTRLEELGLRLLNGRDVTLSTFGTLAPLSHTFRSLNIVMVPNVPLHHLQNFDALLLQAMPLLRRINMWLIGTVPSGITRDESRCISWERRWIYDEDLCMPRQCIMVTPKYDNLWRDKN